MSELRQRLLPIARQPLALVGVLRTFCASASDRAKILADQPALRRVAARFKFYTASLRRTVERWRREAGLGGVSSEPVAGALVKISEGSRALMTLPARGRALVKLVPEPVQLELRKISTAQRPCLPRDIRRDPGRRADRHRRAAMAGSPAVRSRCRASSPCIENAINGELSDLHVKIDDAILQRSPEGPGVLFRLRNIRLIDTDGSIVAQAPLAAIGMSGARCSRAASHPAASTSSDRGWLFYASDHGLSLSFYRPTSSDVEKFVKGTVRGAAPATPEAQPGTPTQSVIVKPSVPMSAGRQLDVTRTVTDVFERARRGNTSYLTRFGVKDAQVVLSREGGQTLWQVPDFSIDLRA